jgi:hypothetical protein
MEYILSGFSSQIISMSFVIFGKNTIIRNARGEIISMYEKLCEGAVPEAPSRDVIAGMMLGNGRRACLRLSNGVSMDDEIAASLRQAASVIEFPGGSRSVDQTDYLLTIHQLFPSGEGEKLDEYKARIKGYMDEVTDRMQSWAVGKEIDPDDLEVVGAILDGARDLVREGYRFRTFNDPWIVE